MGISFANFDGTSFQKPNPGGVRRVLVIIKKDFAAIWPQLSDIVDGQIVNPPVLKTNKVFAEYDCPDASVDVGSQSSGDIGYMSYKHSINFSLAGYSKELIAELSKYQNAGAVFAVEQNDSTYTILGSSDNALALKSDFKSGKKGADKRGFDLKGEQDGFMWDIIPLSNDCVAYLTAPRLYSPEWSFLFH